jgi:hypothetical protein
MKQIEVKQLVDTNQRLCLLIGVMYANMRNPKGRWTNWIARAIEAVVYKNEPLPEMPE